MKDKSFLNIPEVSKKENSISSVKLSKMLSKTYSIYEN